MKYAEARDAFESGYRGTVLLGTLHVPSGELFFCDPHNAGGAIVIAGVPTELELRADIDPEGPFPLTRVVAAQTSCTTEGFLREAVDDLLSMYQCVTVGDHTGLRAVLSEVDTDGAFSAQLNAHLFCAPLVWPGPCRLTTPLFRAHAVSVGVVSRLVGPDGVVGAEINFD